MALVGYGRVSKRDQNPASQRDLLTAAGCEPVFVDKASGKLASRPELDAAMRHLRAGDVLVVTRLDRLGRSVKHLAALAVELQQRQVELRVLQQGIDTTTAVGRLFFHILSAIAEFERELIIERSVEGLAAARARGRNGGRKPTLTPAAVRQVQAMYDSGSVTVDDIAKAFKTTRPTIYRALDRDTIGKRPRASTGTSPADDPAAVAALAAVLDTLPADTRPQPLLTPYDGLLAADQPSVASRDDLLESVNWPDDYRPPCPICHHPTTGLREKHARRGRELIVLAVAEPCGCGVDDHAAALQAAAPSPSAP